MKIKKSQIQKVFKSKSTQKNGIKKNTKKTKNKEIYK